MVWQEVQNSNLVRVGHAEIEGAGKDDAGEEQQDDNDDGLLGGSARLGHGKPR